MPNHQAIITDILQQYLFEENYDIKSELRAKLEDYTESYLSKVCNDDKFQFQESHLILSHSAKILPNFTACGAAVAWNAILRYANNLISQPWRKEFHTIHMFSGYYKHNIDVNLKEAWLIIEKLGYEKFNDKLELQLPLDPDALLAVAKDAITAYVECQMVQAIWESLQKYGANYSWQQIFEYRKLNICHVKSAVAALRSEYMRHRQPNLHCHDHYDMRHHGYAQQPIYGQPRYGMDCYGIPRYNTYFPQAFTPVPVTYCVPPNMYQAPIVGNVPTAQLIEVEGSPMSMAPAIPMPMHHQTPALMGIYGQTAPLQMVGSPVTQPTRTVQSPSSTPRMENGFMNAKSSTYATVDKSRNWDCAPQTHRGQNIPQSQESQHLPESQSDSSGGQGDWGYVYRDLENQGYTKDVGERGDVLRSSAGDGDRILSDVLQRVHIDDRESSDVDCRASLYDNVPTPSKGKSPIEDEPEEGTFWKCAFCTLHNSTERAICEACNRSRMPGPEEQPLASGGPECPKCTLVNKKDAVICEVCSGELKGSPTYV